MNCMWNRKKKSTHLNKEHELFKSSITIDVCIGDLYQVLSSANKKTPRQRYCLPNQYVGYRKVVANGGLQVNSGPWRSRTTNLTPSQLNPPPPIQTTPIQTPPDSDLPNSDPSRFRPSQLQIPGQFRPLKLKPSQFRTPPPPQHRPSQLRPPTQTPADSDP